MKEEIKKLLAKIENHEKRICALESNKNKNQVNKLNSTKKEENYAGPKGGTTLLINEGFFKSKKTSDDVHSTLNKKGYVYKRQVVQTTLNRLSKSKGLLVAFKEGGKKVYVERK